MVKEIKIKAYEITCDYKKSEKCGEVLTIPMRDILTTIADELDKIGWTIINGKICCNNCYDIVTENNEKI